MRALVLIVTLALFTTASCAHEPVIVGGIFTPGYDTLIESNPIIAQEGGAAVIDKDGKHYFVAVGVTSVQGTSSAERLRQIRVGRINALRSAAEFVTPVEVKTETKLEEKTTVVTTSIGKTAQSVKQLDEITRTRVKAVIQAPTQVGTWLSKDGKLFYYAVGGPV